ncbi:MAG: tetratricopeptide repeat protein, partial [Burkholderiales bacterium]
TIFSGYRIRKAIALMCAAAVLAASHPIAQEPEDALRQRARADLQQKDAQTRAGACAVLGELGTPADLPLLMAALYDSDARVRQAAEGAIWQVWRRSGDQATDRVFERGLAQMQSRELPAAVETFSQVIGMKPDFAEGWNKRATVYFLLGENDLSLKDCAEVLKRNPQHFGVLSGYGQIYVRKGDLERALDYFRRALAINPNLEGVRGSIELIEKILVERRRKFI